MESSGLATETDDSVRLFSPSLSNCPLSDDGDTAFCDDLSEITDTASFIPGSIDDDRRSSISTMDGTGDEYNEPESHLKMYLQSPTDSGWNMMSDSQPADSKLKESASSKDMETEFECLAVRRSTSLKTYKTPPGTPHRKKEVRFADALGLDLESIRHIINSSEPPIVPVSATRHLKVDSNGSSSLQTRRRLLHPCFPQPGLSANFAARVTERRVALHSFRADYDVISGTVCVANIAYEKRVSVRYTFDSWESFSDVTATYVDGSNTGTTDLFRFSIQLPDSTGMKCSYVEFSLMFVAGTEVYWDSNFGSNYRVDCYFT